MYVFSKMKHWKFITNSLVCIVCINEEKHYLNIKDAIKRMYRRLQIIRGRKVLRMERLVFIRWKIFVVP